LTILVNAFYCVQFGHNPHQPALIDHWYGVNLASFQEFGRFIHGRWGADNRHVADHSILNFKLQERSGRSEKFLIFGQGMKAESSSGLSANQWISNYVIYKIIIFKRRTLHSSPRLVDSSCPYEVGLQKIRYISGCDIYLGIKNV
jgi:hypothetical protein